MRCVHFHVAHYNRDERKNNILFSFAFVFFFLSPFAFIKIYSFSSSNSTERKEQKRTKNIYMWICSPQQILNVMHINRVCFFLQWTKTNPLLLQLDCVWLFFVSLFRFRNDFGNIFFLYLVLSPAFYIFNS